MIRINIKGSVRKASSKVAARLERKKIRRLVEEDPRTVPCIWHQENNFGDRITPIMFDHFGFFPLLAHPVNAEAMGVGSILQILKDYRNWNGSVLGSGLIHDQSLRLPRAHFVAVRGVRTRDNLGIGESVQLGDPGVLISEFLGLTRLSDAGKIGIVPHYADLHSSQLKSLVDKYRDELILISPRQSVRRVAEELIRCRCVLSSSLHGLIFADSLGIPNVWIKLSDRVVGKGFKFDDYYSSLDISRYPAVITETARLSDFVDEAQLPPASKLEKLKVGLYAALKRYFDDKATCV
jgi:pyruvyltransferase